MLDAPSLLVGSRLATHADARIAGTKRLRLGLEDGAETALTEDGDY